MTSKRPELTAHERASFSPESQPAERRVDAVPDRLPRPVGDAWYGVPALRDDYDVVPSRGRAG